MGTRREASVYTLPLPSAAHLKLSHFTRRLLCSIATSGGGSAFALRLWRDVRFRFAASARQSGLSALTKWLDAPNQFPNYVLSPNSRPKTCVLYQNRRAEIKRGGLRSLYGKSSRLSGNGGHSGNAESAAQYAGHSFATIFQSVT